MPPTMPPPEEVVHEGEDAEKDPGKTTGRPGNEPDQHGDLGRVDSAYLGKVLIVRQAAHHLSVVCVVNEQIQGHGDERHQNERRQLYVRNPDSENGQKRGRQGVELIDVAPEDQARAVSKSE
jgi:hypothetical protein